MAYRNSLVYTNAELVGLTEVSGKNAETFLCKVIKLVEKQIEWTEEQLLTEQNAKHCDAKERKALKWTGSIVEWAELVYALYIVKRINNGFRMDN